MDATKIMRTDMSYPALYHFIPKTSVLKALTDTIFGLKTMRTWDIIVIVNIAVRFMKTILLQVDNRFFYKDTFKPVL